MKRVLLLAIASFLSASAMAATDVNNVTTKKSKATSSTNISEDIRGFRVELIAPIITMKVSAQTIFGKREISESIDSSLGLGLGYAYMPIQRVGFNGKFSYINMTEESSDAGLARIEGNVGMAVNNFFNFKGGLNISKVVALESGDASVYNAGLGIQTSIGLQMSNTIGLDLGYTYMSQSVSFSGQSADVTFSGPEISLTGTF